MSWTCPTLATSSTIGTLVHNVAVTGISDSPDAVRPGETVQFKATLENKDNYLEETIVSVFLDTEFAPSGLVKILAGVQITVTIT